MTNRRLAVTSRSAAFSSPRCTRRARRRSSAGSLMSGSFWMSCRYWSKAPEGLARKNDLALPPFDRSIARAPTVERFRIMSGVGDALATSSKLRLPPREHVPHRALGGRHRPATAVGVHAPNRLRQREPHRSGARLFVELHRREQAVRRGALGELERETAALEQPRDAIGGSRFGDPQH